MTNSTTPARTKGYQTVLRDSAGVPLREKMADFIRLVAIDRFSHLSQSDLAKIANLSGPNLSLLANGKADDFSEIRLLNVIANLGYDIEIKVKPRPQSVIEAEELALKRVEAEVASASTTAGETEVKKRGRKSNPLTAQSIDIPTGIMSFSVDSELASKER